MTTGSGIPAKLAQNIKYLLVRDGMSQNDLATLVGMDSGTFSRTMNGKRKWTLDDLEAVAVAFRLSVPELFYEPADLLRSRCFALVAA